MFPEPSEEIKESLRGFYVEFQELLPGKGKIQIRRL